MRERGFCPSCFNELTGAERERGGICAACHRLRMSGYNDYYDAGEDDGDF
jgi:hypothetical protein